MKEGPTSDTEFKADKDGEQRGTLRPEAQATTTPTHLSLGHRLLRHSLALQMQIADDELPQYMLSCHFPKSRRTAFPLLSYTVPSISRALVLQYLA